MISSMVVRAPGRVLAAALTAVLVLAAVVLSASAASAADPDRLGGEHRFDTARLIAEETFDASVTDVILATGYNYPDALASAGLAGTLGAPVLLTAADELPEETVAALQALSPDNVHIAGGTAVVSEDVETALAADYTVHRYDGLNRYETAALIAEDVPADGNTAIIATGQNFPDAVTGGPLAYAGPHPVLLVTRDAVPQVTEDALNDLNIGNVIILGETEAVSAEVEAELEGIVGSDAVRLGGERRADTAVEIAEYAVENAGFNLNEVLIANGWQNLGVDALAGGPHGGVLTAPILLVQEDDVPPPTEQFLTANATFIDTVRALGGPAVIAEPTLNEAAALATAEAVDFENVTLSWENEYREATGTFRNGEPGATATASVTLNPEDDTVDFTVDFTDVGAGSVFTGFHIHEGGLTDEGPIVVFLATGEQLEAAEGTTFSGTVTTADEADLAATIDAIIANPEGYYLNLHTEAFPAGAVRGQLPDGGQDEIPAADSGVITAVDTTTNTYSFGVGDAAEAREVTYSDADSFVVDGDETATVAEFEADVSIGDEIDFTAGVADSQVHVLTNVDLVAPSVTGSTAASGEFTWNITFSEALDEATLDCTDVTVTDGAQACTGVAFNEGGTVATVTFDAPFAGGETLTLAVESVDDVGGNAGPEAAHALTVVDETAPSVTGSSEVAIGATTWEITFSEALDETTFDCTDVAVAGGAQTCTGVTFNEGGTVATVTFDSEFAGGETLTLAADSVTDLATNTGPAEALTAEVPLSGA